MGLVVVAGDIGGPYVKPDVPPVVAMGAIVSGATKTLFGGRSVALALPSRTTTTLGTIISASLFSTKTIVEGSPVILGGAITNTSLNFLGGVVIAASVLNVNVN